MKKLLWLLLLLPAVLIAQDAAPELGEAPGAVKTFLGFLSSFAQEFLDKNPKLGGALFFIGAARSVLKPLMSLAWTVIKLTPSNKDNETYKKIVESKAGAIAAYLLDYLASFKVKK